MNGTASMAKGSAVRGTLDFLRDALGEDGLARVLRGMEPAVRERVEHASATDEIDYDVLVAL